jgi:hypothetical protein
LGSFLFFLIAPEVQTSRYVGPALAHFRRIQRNRNPRCGQDIADQGEFSIRIRPALQGWSVELTGAELSSQWY